jgi:nitrous oxide reductase accessory protein NosL
LLVNTVRSVIAPLLLGLILSTTTLAAPPPAATPSARDKCPVCGMFVAKYANWVTSSRFKDGSVVYFDGVKDLFTHYFDPSRYTPGRRQGDIAAMTVREYYALKTIDAKSAWFVIGSDVHGPMGNELVPFASRDDAAAFLADHKGKKILRFNEITRQIVKSLN